MKNGTVESDVDKYAVVIADSRELLRNAIAEKLTKNCDVDVVAKAADGYSAIKACTRLKPDFLFLDMSIIQPSAKQVLERVSTQLPDVKVIIVANESNFHTACMTLSQGAVALLPKSARGSDYVNALNAARRNFSYWPTEHIVSLAKARRKLERSGNVYGLSAREVEVLEASVKGKSAKEVAERLNISVRTVQTHKYSIYKKTDCRDIDGLSVIAASFPPG